MQSELRQHINPLVHLKDQTMINCNVIDTLIFSRFYKIFNEFLEIFFTVLEDIKVKLDNINQLKKLHTKCRFNP